MPLRTHKGAQSADWHSGPGVVIVRAGEEPGGRRAAPPGWDGALVTTRTLGPVRAAVAVGRGPCSLARAQGLSSDAAGGSAGQGQSLQPEAEGAALPSGCEQTQRGHYTRAPQLPGRPRRPGPPCFLLLIRQHQNQQEARERHGTGCPCVLEASHTAHLSLQTCERRGQERGHRPGIRHGGLGAPPSPSPAAGALGSPGRLFLASGGQ